MAKKRKLNSTNPKYYSAKEDEVKERKKLIATVKLSKKRKANVYAVFNEE